MNRRKLTPTGAKFFSQLKSKLYSGDANKPFFDAHEFFSQKFKEHKGRTATHDPIGLLVHHLNNGLTPLDGDLYMIIDEKRTIHKKHYGEVLTNVDHFLDVIAEPLTNVREKLRKIFPKAAEYAEADRHLKALEAWRDKIKNEIKPSLADKVQEVAPGHYAGR